MKKYVLDKVRSKKLIALVCLSTAISCTSFKVASSELSPKEEIIQEVETKEPVLNKKIQQIKLESKKESMKVEVKEESMEVESKETPIYELDFGLDQNLQKMIYDKCSEFELDFIKTMGLIYCESKFQPDLISSTNDYGLFQINRVNHKRLSETLKTKNDPLDSKINIEWGTYFLHDLYSYWKKKGLTGKELDHHVWSTYNKGLGGFRKNGPAIKYIEKVNEGIEYLETIIEDNKRKEDLESLYVVREQLKNSQNNKKIKVK